MLLKQEPQRQHLACLGTWVLYHNLRIMIQYLLSGFELELYSMHEYYYIYWWGLLQLAVMGKPRSKHVSAKSAVWGAMCVTAQASRSWCFTSPLLRRCLRAMWRTSSRLCCSLPSQAEKGGITDVCDHTWLFFSIGSGDWSQAGSLSGSLWPAGPSHWPLQHFLPSVNFYCTCGTVGKLFWK